MCLNRFSRLNTTEKLTHIQYEIIKKVSTAFVCMPINHYTNVPSSVKYYLQKKVSFSVF